MRWDPRLDLTVLGLQRHDLCGSKILGCHNLATIGGCIVQVHMFGPDAQRERPALAIHLAWNGYARTTQINSFRALAQRPVKIRKFMEAIR